MLSARSVSTALACLAIAACSANSGQAPGWNSGSGASAGNGGSHQGGSPSGGSGGSHAGGGGGGVDLDAGNPFGGSPGDAAPMPDGDTCSAQSVDAKPYPLDMYVMMDQSGSMTIPAGMGVPPTTKWQAAVNAFSQFLTTNNTTGLGMGIQYFPLPVKPWNSLTSCSSSCSSGYLCMDSTCRKKCTADSQCPDAECLTEKDQDGNVVGRACSNSSCVVSDYEVPDVEIGPLPQNNQALIGSLKAHKPTTMTPTAPALRGAIDHARKWAQTHTDRKVIVVLATDGMPSVCDADDSGLVQKVAQIAKDGVNGSPSILTFVIGVVMQGNAFASGALNQMAKAGGTGQAFIVDPNQDMTGAFTQALQNIRGAVMQCEFLIPDAPYLSYDKVNVVWEAVDGKKYTVYHVSDLAHCDPNQGGWYYDTDPKQQKPSKITLCPNSCDFMQHAGGKINIEMGCQTVEMPK